MAINTQQKVMAELNRLIRANASQIDVSCDLLSFYDMCAEHGLQLNVEGITHLRKWLLDQEVDLSVVFKNYFHWLGIGGQLSLEDVGLIITERIFAECLFSYVRCKNKERFISMDKILLEVMSSNRQNVAIFVMQVRKNRGIKKKSTAILPHQYERIIQMIEL